MNLMFNFNSYLGSKNSDQPVMLTKLKCAGGLADLMTRSFYMSSFIFGNFFGIYIPLIISDADVWLVSKWNRACLKSHMFTQILWALHPFCNPDYFFRKYKSAAKQFLEANLDYCDCPDLMSPQVCFHIILTQVFCPC